MKRGYSFTYFYGYWLLDTKIKQTLARLIGRVWGWRMPMGSYCKMCHAPLRPWLRNARELRPSCQFKLCCEYCPF